MNVVGEVLLDGIERVVAFWNELDDLGSVPEYTVGVIGVCSYSSNSDMTPKNILGI